MICGRDFQTIHFEAGPILLILNIDLTLKPVHYVVLINSIPVEETHWIQVQQRPAAVDSAG